MSGSGSSTSVGGSRGGNAAGSGSTSSSGNSSTKDLFYYHTGSVWGVSTERNKEGGYIATVGEDKRLCVWDTGGSSLISRYVRFLELFIAIFLICLADSLIYFTQCWILF